MISESELSETAAQTAVVKTSRYQTDEYRRKHAEYQRRWRQANPEKVKQIYKKSYLNEFIDPIRSSKRKRRIKAYREKPENKSLRHLQKARYYAKTRFAMNGNQRWSDYEIQMAFNRDLTDTQIAAELGRSVQAVGQARIRYADRAPIGWVKKASSS